jgi:hypothetical protein
MSWIAYLLALGLLGAGGWSALHSIDLLPTEMGFFYAISAVLAGCTAVLTFVIGALIHRIGALRRVLVDIRAAAQTLPVEAPPPAPEAAPRAPEPAPVEPPRSDAPAVEEPAAAPPEDAAVAKVVGRYSANGVDYTLYSDGSIETNTTLGVRRYHSMAELRGSLARPGGEGESEGGQAT